ncbi:MAG: leucine-rich repeat protein [Ruminococcus sp.]|nr:leucine-rich repeat protein [Ruminococcus sp.]
MKRNYMKAAAGVCALLLVLNGMTMPVQAKDQFSAVSVITSAETEVPTEGTCGENTVWKFTEDGTLEISGTGAMEHWASTLNRPWQDFKDSIDKIVVYEGVTSIGTRAFADCNNLTEIYLPDGLKTISYSAFDSCVSLESVVVPSGVESIGEYAFSRCSVLKDVEIGDGVKTIGNAAFYDCYSMKKIAITSNLESIGKNTLFRCFELEGIYFDGTLSEWYTFIDNSIDEFIGDTYHDVIVYCSDGQEILKKVSITTSTTTTITETTTTSTTTTSETATETTTSWVLTGPEGMQTTTVATTTADNWEDENSGKFGDFYYTIQLDGTISIEYTGTDAHVEIPAEINGRKVSVVAAEAFRYNENVEHVVIPEGISEIQPGAFMECSNLKSVVIPESVSEINEDTFLGCDSLESLTIENPECIIHMANYTLPENVIIRCKSGSTAEAFAETFGYQVEILNNVVLTEEEIGDVSGDGTVGVDDATLVLTYYAMNAAGLEMTFNEDSAVNERLMAAADTDMDSLVSISDATMVLTYYAQNAAGLNPTWEGLRSK